MSRINDYLYIGDYKDAGDYHMLKNRGITHILCAAGELRPNFPDHFEYKYIRGSDDPYFDLSRHFDEAADFIHGAVRGGGQVLIHCYAGVSRSTSCTIAYLIKHEGYTFEEALELCRSGRSIVEPNSGFVQQLRSFCRKHREQRSRKEQDLRRSSNIDERRSLRATRDFREERSKSRYAERQEEDSLLRERRQRLPGASSARRDRKQRERNEEGNRFKYKSPTGARRNEGVAASSPRTSERDRKPYARTAEKPRMSRSVLGLKSERKKRSPRLVEDLDLDYDQRVRTQRQRAMMLGSSSYLLGAKPFRIRDYDYLDKYDGFGQTVASPLPNEYYW